MEQETGAAVRVEVLNINTSLSCFRDDLCSLDFAGAFPLKTLLRALISTR
jgi:hypothetical protein